MKVVCPHCKLPTEPGGKCEMCGRMVDGITDETLRSIVEAQRGTTRTSSDGNRRRIHPRLELLVAQRLDLGPAGDLRTLRARDHLRRRADTDVQRTRDLAVATVVHPLQSKDLSRLSHGQLLRR